MRRAPPVQRRQSGTVAVVFGLALVALLAVGGLVLDLGHLYVVKTELQNAADSAALAGAKDLDQSATGITKAAAAAVAIAARHRYDFSTTVTLSSATTSTNIYFGSTPDGPWSSIATASASPSGLTFIKVDTGSVTLTTWLMKAAGISSMDTSGVAVAGRFVNDINPMGICAVDPANRTKAYSYASGMSELVEFGFRRGVAYNLFGMNPLPGGPSDPYLVNPVDGGSTTCSPSHSSAAFTAPFMCGGNSAVVSTGTGTVYTNTGNLNTTMERAINSRFDDFPGGTVCDPVTSPPDTNVKEYPCKGSGIGCVTNNANTVSVTPPINWLEPSGNTLPSQETISVNSSKLPNYQLPTAGSVPVPSSSYAEFQTGAYGVLWAYGPAYKAVTSGSTVTEGAAMTTAEANANPLYSVAAQNVFDTTSSSNYPTTPGAGFDASLPASPYNQTSGNYFQAPTHTGQQNRRLLNLALVDCRVAPVGGASCGAMSVVGIGKFFLLTRASLNGSNPQLNVEFAGLISPVPNSEIKLYR